MYIYYTYIQDYKSLIFGRHCSYGQSRYVPLYCDLYRYMTRELQEAVAERGPEAAQC